MVLEGVTLKKVLVIICLLVLIFISGCGGPGALKGPREYPAVTFEQEQSLQYRFVSSRDIDIDWGSMGEKGKSAKKQVDRQSESFEMVVAYEAIEADPYGLTNIKAACKSVKVNRKGGRKTRDRRDAAEDFAGKSFVITIEPNGKIQDYSNLHKLIKKMGEGAFTEDPKRGRIKSPDMICDFVASQWFLWDSISSIEDPIEGVRVGESWGSKLPIPSPMVMREARSVEYTLSEIRETDNGRVAVIKSVYSPSETVPDSWAVPYSGYFQMKGTFGFLRGYKILELTGTGEELFNLDTGRIERQQQEYQMKISAKFPLGLGIEPEINIRQKLTMEPINSN